MIHAGTGYIQNGGIGGGHYNNAFHELIRKNGDYDRVTAEDLVRMRDLLVRIFDI
jgi:hypothetical protein